MADRPARTRQCPGTKVNGDPCSNRIADPKKPVCGACRGTGARSTTVTADIRAGLRRLARHAANDNTRVVVDTTADVKLTARPTTELVTELRSLTAAALAGHSNALRAGPGPAGTAARDAAEAARREVSRYEDAVLTRHPDPYGAALTRHAWEHGSGAGGTSAASTARQWLADTPDARPVDIHRALNTIAEDDVGVADLQLKPWVNDLNRYAALRAAHQHNAGGVDHGEVQAAELAWRARRPARV